MALAGPTPVMSTSNKLDQELAKFEYFCFSVETWLSTLAGELSLLHDDQGKLWNKVTEDEKNMTILQPIVADNKCEIHNLEEQLHCLEERVEDIEGCSQRSNMRILGLPEGVEGQDPIAYLEN
ncbi:hypothetical protein NDU88_004995 [Pleurodeles waltl]|uniref:Uncharacterized protein n=1 Tax=Pleurodeles waltl TaxID=8319 RepID=A0AAV7WA99_PLEWA|nr:hypothetical protein NDU88_004995 [Pleurodeles waltl]